MEPWTQAEVAIAALASLLGLLVLHVGWRSYSTKKVMEQGVLANAEVLSSRWWGHGTRVKFKFDAMGHEKPIVAKRMLESTFVKLHVGDAIRIKYLPRRPHFCVVLDFQGTHDAR